MRVATTITFIRSLWTSLFVQRQYMYHHFSPRRDSIVLSALLPPLSPQHKNCYAVVVVVAAVVAQMVDLGSDDDHRRRRLATDRPGSW